MVSARSLALSARGVGVTLGRRSVLEAIDFGAEFGTVLCVLGPNGAGKTTLLRAAAGLIPYRGRIELAGAEVSSLPPRERGRRLAFVPQRSAFGARLPVYTLVSHGRYAHRGGLAPLSAEDRAAIERALLRADVAELAERELPTLSLGEQRRVLLARALATEARVLLLDEPAASLDVAHALALFRSLRALAADGYCVVLVLHQLDDALRFTDSSLLLERGKSVACGPTREVITPEHVRRVYGVESVPGGALGFRLGEDGP